MSITRFCSLVAGVVLIFFLGCQHAAIAYRLRRDGFDPVVLPPTTADETSESLSVAIKHARHTIPKGIDCDIMGELVSLRWTKSTAQVSFKMPSLFAPDQSPNQVGRGMYVDPFLAADKFRLDLAERESEGCLSAVENERLRRAIVENFPLQPDLAYSLQLGSYSVSGYFDLTSDFRMQITSPIYAAGAQPSTGALLGYETANYQFTAEGNLLRPRLASATETLIGSPPIEASVIFAGDGRAAENTNESKRSRTH